MKRNECACGLCGAQPWGDEIFCFLCFHSPDCQIGDPPKRSWRQRVFGRR